MNHSTSNSKFIFFKNWLCRILVLYLFLFVTFPPSHSHAQQEQAAKKNKVKIAFVYNFAKFTTWPKRSFETLPKNSFSICLLGKDPLGFLLDQLAESKKIFDKTILVRKNPPLEEFRNCRILYISSSESWRLDNILKTLKGKPVLTIGNKKGYAERGVGINLFEKKGRLSFEINRKAILKSGLTLSSELLALGVLVEGKE